MADVVPPLDAGEILRRLQSAGFCTEIDRSSDGNPHLLFDRTLSAFLTLLRRQAELRRLPPVISDGQTVNLFRLFSAVRSKGGRSSGDVDDAGALVKMVEWVKKVAKNPLDLEISSVSSGGSMINDNWLGEMFFRLLRARKAMLFRDVPWMSNGGSLWRDFMLNFQFERLGIRVSSVMFLVCAFIGLNL
ncbi:putative transcription regulator ARID family [Dioscorea sansibarensis]